MSYDCVCWKTYTCLRCEDIANGIRKPTGERIRRVVTITNRLVAECGTRSGYKRHRANGEVACAECKSAQNESVKEYMRRKKAS